MSMTYQRQILNKVLNTFASRLISLEQSEKAKEAELLLCHSYIKEIQNNTNIGKQLTINPQRQSESGSNFKSIREFSKGFRTFSRPTTPSNKSLSRKDSSGKGRNIGQNVRKNLENNPSLNSQKTSLTNVRIHPTKKSRRTVKTPDKVKVTFSPAERTITRKPTPSKFLLQEKSSIDKSRKKNNKININIKKQNGYLDISKSSLNDIQKTRTSALNTSASNKVLQNRATFKNMKNEFIPSKYHTENAENLKYVKSELDVSSLITLEQDVNDELIINQKEDKLFITSLYGEDENINIYRPTKSIVKKNEIEEILDEKWEIFSSFLNKYDLISLIFLDKKFYKLCLSKLLSHSKIEISKYQEKIININNKYSEKELSLNLAEFTLSKGSVKAIDLLNTPLYTKLFNTNSIPHEDIVFPYRLFFNLIGKRRMQLNNFDFWSECCNFFIGEEMKTGEIIFSNISKIDVSDENIFKTYRMIQNKEKLITPNYYSKTCATTGLIIFILKDILEYVGLISDKKTLPSQMLKLNRIFLTKSQEIYEKLLDLDRKFQFN